MLTSQEVRTVVNQYIGVSGGYLGDFSYRTHADFYPEYCGLDYDPDGFKGTTRERFIQILSSAPAHHQAKILRGVLDRFPLDSFREEERERKRAVAARIDAMIARLEGTAVGTPAIPTGREVVEHALADADAAITAGRPAFAVDRLHTALHGYARELCARHNVALSEDASLPQAFSALQRAQALGARPEALRILRGLSGAVESLNSLRNHATPAHPNDLLDEADAHLAVNAARTLLAYLNARLGS